MIVKKNYYASYLFNILTSEWTTLDEIVVHCVNRVPPENAIWNYKRNNERRINTPAQINKKIWSGVRNIAYDALRNLVSQGYVEKQTPVKQRSAPIRYRLTARGVERKRNGDRNNGANAIAAHS